MLTCVFFGENYWVENYREYKNPPPARGIFTDQPLHEHSSLFSRNVRLPGLNIYILFLLVTLLFFISPLKKVMDTASEDDMDRKQILEDDMDWKQILEDDMDWKQILDMLMTTPLASDEEESVRNTITDMDRTLQISTYEGLMNTVEEPFIPPPTAPIFEYEVMDTSEALTVKDKLRNHLLQKYAVTNTADCHRQILQKQEVLNTAGKYSKVLKVPLRNCLLQKKGGKEMKKMKKMWKEQADKEDEGGGGGGRGG